MFHHLRFRWTLSLAFLCCSCSSNTSPADGGVDSGVPRVPQYCGTPEASCDATHPCCGNLTCTGGLCTPPSLICAGNGQFCTATIPCCAPTNPGPGLPSLYCEPLDAGVGFCTLGTAGTSCGPTRGCGAPYACIDGGCALPTTNHECVLNVSTPCVLGDDCNGSALAIQSTGETVDPCASGGLICAPVEASAAGYLFQCRTPASVKAATFPATSQPPLDLTVCSLGDECRPDYSDGRTADTCGSFWLGTGDDHCFPSCTRSEDCPSLAQECIGGLCVPYYCYADSTDVGPFSQGQDASVASDASVLFQPCPNDGGLPTDCLPQPNGFTGSAAGICFRVGGTSANGIGGVCDPTGYRSDLGSLCPSGSLCDDGTCLPWCDASDPTLLTCPLGARCFSLDNTFHTQDLGTGGVGYSHSSGVCAQSCNPYAKADSNPCTPLNPASANPTYTVCKFSGSTNDYFPPPGICLAGATQPLAVGQACSPYGWIDPCVSGAQCFAVPGDGGRGFRCQQLCDPTPSPNVEVPRCPSATPSCNVLCASTECAHLGTCQ